MDSFSAVPRMRKFIVDVVDDIALEEWMTSDDIDAPIPTIKKILVGYEKGPGTPVPVQIEVDSIESEYADNLPTDEVRQTMSVNQYADAWSRVNMLLRRNLLMAVVRGMDMDSANVLSAPFTNENGRDIGQGRRILEQLGWLETQEEVQARIDQSVAEQKEDAENKEEGNLETGQST